MAHTHHVGSDVKVAKATVNKASREQILEGGWELLSIAQKASYKFVHCSMC